MRINTLTQLFCQIDIKTDQFSLRILRFEGSISRIGTDTNFLRDGGKDRGNAGKGQQEIAFTDKLYAADSRLVVKKGSPVTPDLATLKGKRVGVLQGTTQETYGNEHWAPKGIEIVSYQGQDNIYSDLTAGRIDAAFQDEVAASEGFLKQPIGKDYQFGGPSIKDEKLFGVGTGMGLRKEDNELREALNKAFAEMRKDGTYDKLAKKYFDFNVYGE